MKKIISLFLVLFTFNSFSRKENNVLDYFDMIYPNIQKNWDGFYWQLKDIENGFLRFSARMEGGAKLILFKGVNYDIIISDSYGCGPECKHDYQFYVYIKSELKKINKEKAFPFASIKNHLLQKEKLIHKVAKTDSLTSWGSVILYEAQTNRSYVYFCNSPPDSYNVNAFMCAKGGVVKWNGKGFTYVKAKRLVIQKGDPLIKKYEIL